MNSSGRSNFLALERPLGDSTDLGSELREYSRKADETHREIAENLEVLRKLRVSEMNITRYR